MLKYKFSYVLTQLETRNRSIGPSLSSARVQSGNETTCSTNVSCLSKVVITPLDLGSSYFIPCGRNAGILRHIAVEGGKYLLSTWTVLRAGREGRT